MVCNLLGCPVARALWALDPVGRGAWLFLGIQPKVITAIKFICTSWPLTHALWAVDSVSRGAWLFLGYPILY